MPKKAKISAVICELNPLHLGHRALFRQARELSDAVVCILSGNFVQRGEPAILDKWARRRLALENGADLVLELPLPWACAGAERFAGGGVSLATALGNVDLLVFGSEVPDPELLRETAEALLSPGFSEKLAALPDRGETFARRREEALVTLLGPKVLPVLRSPNAILAVEYCKALLLARSSILPAAIPRQGAGHDLEGGPGQFCSAMRLRKLLRAGRPVGGLVPETTERLLRELSGQGQCPVDVKNIERSILCKLRTMDPAAFAALPDVSEGLENRLWEASRQAGSLEEWYALAKSKRYTLARLRRLSMYAFLGVTRDLPPSPPYLRILGMNETGEKILRSAAPTLPLVGRPADVKKLGDEARRVFALEAAADDLYALACPVPQPCGRDHTEKLLRV